MFPVEPLVIAKNIFGQLRASDIDSPAWQPEHLAATSGNTIKAG